MPGMVIQGAGELEPLDRPGCQVQRFPGTLPLSPEIHRDTPGAARIECCQESPAQPGTAAHMLTLQTGPGGGAAAGTAGSGNPHADDELRGLAHGYGRT